MSAILNPIPPAPQQPAPAPVVEKPGRPAWFWLLLLLAITGGAYGVWSWNARRTEDARALAAVPIKTATVTQGVLENRMRVSGHTSAVNYMNVSAPRLFGPEAGRPLVLLKMPPTGTMVKKGQEIVVIDGQSLQDHADDVNSTVVQAEADIKKRKAEQSVEWENLQQNVRVAKAELDKLRVDARATEVRTVVDQELIKLAVEEADATHKELVEELRLKKISQDAEMRILNLTRERHARHRDRHQKDVYKYKVTSPMDGMFVVQSIFRGGEFVPISAGDQVWPGQMLAKVVDPASMQIEGTINQAEIGSIRIGEHAEVSIDAFPGLKMQGKVFSIGALAVAGATQQAFYRTIPVRIMIDGFDPRVIPDLSASGDVLVGKHDQATMVPLGAVREEKGKQFVYVKDGSKYVTREIKLAARNDITGAVSSGLTAGDEVALNYEVATIK